MSAGAAVASALHGGSVEIMDLEAEAQRLALARVRQIARLADLAEQGDREAADTILRALAGLRMYGVSAASACRAVSIHRGPA